MKKLLIAFLAVMQLAGFQAQAKKLKAMLSYATFHSPDNGPYIETYLSVMGNSVSFAKMSNGKYQGAIQVSILFKQNNEIKFADKYNLLSQEVEDTNQINFNFLDQQRITLPNGEYTFELTISDKHSADKPFNSSQQVVISYPDDKVSISGVQLLESYKKTETNSSISKNGFDLVPFVNNFYPVSNNSLKFYAEIYNTKKVMQGNGFLVSYYVEDYETKLTLEKYKMFSKQQPRDVNVVLSEFNISDLPSGNYNLVVEVRNNKNDLMAMQQTFFQRSGNAVAEEIADDLITADITNTFVENLTDSVKLMETIRSFRPIASNSENNFEDYQLKKADVKSMQHYVYRFWKIRNAENPEGAFKTYMADVEVVNTLYKTPIQRGYETDRGRVYLQYGAPNDIVKQDREPSTYPYEIWHFYKIKNQSNKKFIFYNTDLVTNDYQLLHSDMPGEVYEPQWQIVLHKRDTQTRDYQTTKTRQGSFGEHSDTYGDRNGDDNLNRQNPHK